MYFDIITIFPKIFDSYLNESMIKRARTRKLVDIRVYDLRDYVKVAPRRIRQAHRGEFIEPQAGGNLPPRRQIDDRPYGGGPGMVLKAEPIIKAIGSLLKPSNPKSQIPNPKQIPKSKLQKSKTKIILFSAVGKQFTQKMARDWAKKYERIIMIAGHYEGVDERIENVVADFARSTSSGRPERKSKDGFRISDLSIGPYVLTGGELPAMVVIDAVSRHIPGVLGKEQSLEEKRCGVGVPIYTRPEVFIWRRRKYAVPRVLLSGNHAKINTWRKTHMRKQS